jgi:hypothetical protein
MGILDGNYNSHASAIHLSKITATSFRVRESLVFYAKAFAVQPENVKKLKKSSSVAMTRLAVLVSASQTRTPVIPSDLSAA